MTADAYAANLQGNIDIGAAVKKRALPDQAGPTLLHSESQRHGKALGIPALEDKLVQLACAKLLTAIYEQDFLECSYGYRPGRGALDAVRDLTFDLQYGRYGYLIEADIQGFFDHMDHTWLLDMLRLRIDDRAFLRLIHKWLKAGILDTDGQVVHPETGTPQGGTVSPVLANVYLHYALDLWFEQVVKPHCRVRHCCAAMRMTGCVPSACRRTQNGFFGCCPRGWEIPPPGGAGEDPSAPVQPFSPQHEAALHLSGI